MDKQPNAKIILLDILPLVDWKGERVMLINEIIAKYNDNTRIYYLEMCYMFQTSPGVLIEEMYTPDKVHLSLKGYEVWYELMEPLFSKLLVQ